MIYGIGTDLCQIHRIQAALDRHGVRFAKRILGPSEWQVYERREAFAPGKGLNYLATRFSAKEAFSKAVGLGLRAPMTWRCCEILNQTTGQPYLQLHDELATWFEQHHLLGHVSVSDENDYAASFVVVERKNS
ncbi:MAG: holo-ACP synthase [Burkholderiales bacterium]|jgi:holo-[acyl-carrier protein] synthase